MSIKLKALGLGLLAVLAMSALAVTNASAIRSGHFSQDSGGTATITGTQTSTHKVKFHTDHGTPIECTSAHYHGKATTATTQEILVTPTYSDCHTEGSATNIPVHTNECHFKFTSNSNASTHSPTEDATTGLVCPPGVSGVIVTHPNCTMRMPPQTVKGVTYTTITVNNKHAITLNVTVNTAITAHYEGGICIFLGTTHQGSMTGSAIVEGFDSKGNPINLTAT